MRKRLEEALWRLPNKFYAQLQRVCRRLGQSPEKVMAKSIEALEKSLEDEPPKASPDVRAYFSKVARAGAKQMSKKARIERARRGAEAMHENRRKREAEAKKSKPKSKTPRP